MSKVLASLASRAASVESKYETENVTIVNMIVSDKFDYRGEDKDGKPIHIAKTGVVFTIDGDESGKQFTASVPTNTLKFGDPLDYVGTKCVATFTPYEDKEGNEQWGLSHITMKASNAVLLASKGAVFALQN